MIHTDRQSLGTELLDAIGDDPTARPDDGGDDGVGGEGLVEWDFGADSVLKEDDRGRRGDHGAEQIG